MDTANKMKFCWVLYWLLDAYVLQAVKKGTCSLTKEYIAKCN